MAHDGSLASQVEDWIVEQIQALQVGGQAAFAAEDVRAWEGTESESVRDFSEELFEAARSRIARVLFTGDRPLELEYDQIRLEPTYLILVGLKNYRPGSARRGESTTAGEWGTNKMRDLLAQTFSLKQPDKDNGVMHTDLTHYRGATIEYHPRNTCIMRVEIVVEESSIAA